MSGREGTIDEAVIEHFGDDPTIEMIERSMSHHGWVAPMKPLGKPCHDCAVMCGFYEVYAHVLKRLPRERQLFHADRWFCHNHTDRACAGVREYCGLPSPSNEAGS